MQGKLFTVFSAKGGGGATTLAINLAYEIQTLMQEPVVLLDMDQLYSNAAMLLKVRPLHCLKELNQHPIEEVDQAILSQVATRQIYGFDLVTSSKDIQGEQEMLSPKLLILTLDYLLARYNYVIVDVPSYVLDTYHQILIERADNTLITSLLDISSIYRTRQYINLVKENQLSEKLRLVINRSDLQGAFGLSNQELEEEFGVKPYARLSDNWSLTVKAHSLGLPLSEVGPDSDLVADIKQLAANLVDLGLDELAPLEHKRFSKLDITSLNKGFMKLFKKGLSNNAYR